jgi:hypothetical protein
VWLHLYCCYTIQHTNLTQSIGVSEAEIGR